MNYVAGILRQHFKPPHAQMNYVAGIFRQHFKTSLNVVLVSSLLAFEKSPPKHYLISRIIYLLIMFVYLVRNSKGYKIVALDGGQFLPFKDAG